MKGRIPDFGRASVDQFDKMATGVFKKKEETVKAKDVPDATNTAVDQFDGLVKGFFNKSKENSPAVFTTGLTDFASWIGEEPGSKKWTVLLYMDGNNNLYGPMYDAMKGLESVGSNQDVNLVVEIGGNPGENHHGGFLDKIMESANKHKKIDTVKRYYVTKDYLHSDKITSPQLADLGKQDMGDPKVVSDFLKWGIQNYPADHYAVIFFNHGAGFAGSLSDEASGNLVDTNELKVVVEEAAQAAGKKIDLVDFDSCLMAQIEVADAIKDSARYMVASEETERGMAQPLPRIMKDLQEGSTGLAMDPADLAKLLCILYIL